MHAFITAVYEGFMNQVSSSNKYTVLNDLKWHMIDCNLVMQIEHSNQICE